MPAPSVQLIIASARRIWELEQTLLWFMRRGPNEAFAMSDAQRAKLQEALEGEQMVMFSQMLREMEKT